jgi:hypothetical protein
MNTASKRLYDNELRHSSQASRNNRQRLGKPAKMAVLEPI